MLTVLKELEYFASFVTKFQNLFCPWKVLLNRKIGKLFQQVLTVFQRKQVTFIL